MHRHRSHGEAGLTIIEVVVTALIVALLAAAVSTALVATTHFSGDQRLRSQAEDLAQQDLERVRGMSDEQLNGLNQVASRTVQLDGAAFTITSGATYLNTQGGSSCGSSPGTAYYKVRSDVNWSSNTRAPVAEETIIARPVAGTLLVEVNDETGTGLRGATVTATGPTPATGVTDSLGCATFSGLASGTYTIAASDSGYMDPTSSTSPNSTLSLPTSGPVAPFTLARFGTITATFMTQATGGSASCPPTTGLCTGQQADALSWQGAGSVLSMSAPKSYGPVTAAAQLPATGSGATIQLFPFAFSGTGGTYNYTNNYQVWAGECAQMQPPTTPTAYDKFSVAPGSSQSVAVQEPALNIVVTYGGVRVAPTDIKISFTSTTGPACSDSWYAAIASDAATDGNGSLAYPGQPYAPSTAPLKICADYMPTGSTTYYSNVAAPLATANTSFAAATTVTIPLTGTSTGKC